MLQLGGIELLKIY